jgi:hypothetical protein
LLAARSELITRQLARLSASAAPQHRAELKQELASIEPDRVMLHKSLNKVFRLCISGVFPLVDRSRLTHHQAFASQLDALTQLHTNLEHDRLSARAELITKR